MSSKDEIFDYVMHSPENTNPAVLRSLLDGIEGGTEYFDVTYTQATSEDTPTVNKTFTEIKSAYETGKIIRLKWSDNTYFLDNLFKGGKTLCNSAWYDDNVLDKISFLAVGYGTTSDTYYNIVVSIENDDGNAWIYTTCQSYG